MATTEARFNITDRISKITQIGKVVKVNPGADTFRRNANGERTKVTLWNTIAVVGKPAEYVTLYRKKGDLVRVRGELRDSSYQNDKGETVWTTDRNVDCFDFLRAAKDEQEEQATSDQDADPIQL
jgi:single-stranded DNA-binding protein